MITKMRHAGLLVSLWVDVEMTSRCDKGSYYMTYKPDETKVSKLNFDEDRADPVYQHLNQRLDLTNQRILNYIGALQ